MGWRVLTWLAIVIAAVAAVSLGVDAVVAGLGKAAGLAGVIAGFCELGALALAVTGWAGHRREAAERPAPEPARGPERTEPAQQAGQAGTPPGGGSGKYGVDARQAEGVQIGDGNTQHNDFRRNSGRTDER